MWLQSFEIQEARFGKYKKCLYKQGSEKGLLNLDFKIQKPERGGKNSQWIKKKTGKNIFESNRKRAESP